VRDTVETLCAWTEDSLVQAEVVGIREQTDGVLLQTTAGFWHCQQVVVCAGLSTPALVAPLGIDLPLRITCHARPTFRAVAESRWPCLQDLSGHWGEHAYGSIAEPGLYALGLRRRSELPVKRGEQLTADADLRQLTARTREYVARALPGLDPDPVSVRICFTTRIPGTHDGFWVRRSERVTVIAGHNLFKFAPALGQLLAKAVVEGGAPEEQVVVPQAALLTDQLGVYVFVAEDGKAAIRRIKTAGSSGENIVVTDGLCGGEQVIVEGLQALRAGVAVRAAPATPALNQG